MVTDFCGVVSRKFNRTLHELCAMNRLDGIAYFQGVVLSEQCKDLRTPIARAAEEFLCLLVATVGQQKVGR